MLLNQISKTSRIHHYQDFFRVTVCVLAIITNVISVSIVSGQVSIIPLVQELSINAGGKAQFNLQIANRSDRTMTFSMRSDNFDISREGLPSPTQNKTDWNCAEWITFTPSIFELEPDEVQIVQGSMSAPASVVGGHYAFLTCHFREPTDPISFDPDEGARTQYEFGRAVSSSLLVTVRSSKNNVQLRPDSLFLSSGRGEISDVGYDPFAEAERESDVWEVTIPVTNTGNLHAVATGRVNIWTEDMRLVASASLLAGKGYVLPGKTRMFRAHGKRQLDDGIYMVRVDIRSREGKISSGAFPFYIVQGTAVSEVPTEKVLAMLEALSPKFRLSKNYLDINVTPNSKRFTGLRLMNYTQDTLSITARPVTWTVDDLGKVILDPDHSELIKPCAAWLTVSPNPIVIRPKGAASVKVSVTAPSELQGEYYGAVIFETEDMQKDLATELQLGRTVLISVSSATGLVSEANIEVAAYEPVSPLMRTFTISVGNKGNVHCFVSGQLSIYDKNWDVVLDPVTFGSTQDYLMPEKSRDYVVPCTGALEPGHYKAVFEVKYSDDARSEVTEFYFDAY